MTDPFVIAKGEQDYAILPRMMNRHGMIPNQINVML
jgi:hypothetical protein